MKRTLEELRKDANNPHTALEFRKLHKELKEYGDGILFRYRYPRFMFILGSAILPIIGALIGSIMTMGIAALLGLM